ncbi:MAG TPA: hypothetical protein VK348_06515 [Planctomycetota bacterium]|nr:hypothetical protein [Planctomycetota bacterium]
MKPATLLGIALVLVPACRDSGVGAEAAVATFRNFQTALRAGDQTSCSQLLTEQSQAALTEIPWAQVREQKPLLILGARRVGMEWWVAIKDPNAGNRAGNFVVVPENGRLVVDLVASAQHAATTIVRDSTPRLEPRALSPKDLERAHQRELAEPPK